VKGFAYRRVKNDERDASDLADLLRMSRLPEAWIAPPAVRELVRYRAKLVALRSGLKAQVHAVLAKEGVRVSMSDLFGRQGMALLAEVPLGRAYRLRVDSLVKLIDAFDGEAERLRRLVADELADRRGYQATQAIPAWMGRGA
jgi:transposase